jgi:hypothetical protein
VTDVEDLVRERYLEVLGVTRPAADSDTVATLMSAARGRRRERMAIGGCATAVGALALAIVVHALIASPQLPTGGPTPAPSASGSPAPSTADEVTYVTSLPGIGTVIPDNLGGQTPSGLPGAPDFYRTSQAIVDYAGPGWGYTVFGPIACTATIPHPVAVLVDPWGEAFRADDFPDDVCTAMPVAASGRLLLVDTGSTDQDTPLYLVNFATGAVNYLDAGASPYAAEQVAISRGTMIVALRSVADGTDSSVAISIDADGRQQRVDLGVDPRDLYWGESGGYMLFMPAAQDGRDPEDIDWRVIAPGALSAEPLQVQVSAGVHPAGCNAQTLSGPDGVTFLCDNGTFALHSDGELVATEPLTDHLVRLAPSYEQRAVGDVGALNAHVGYPLDSGTVMALDPTYLDPLSHGPWQRESEVTAIGTRINDRVGGIEVSVVQPDGELYYGMVVALVGDSGTMVVLPSSFHGEASTAGEWLWWSGD